MCKGIGKQKIYSKSSNRVDSKKLKADYPDIYKECVKASESRRFTVKEIA